MNQPTLWTSKRNRIYPPDRKSAARVRHFCLVPIVHPALPLVNRLILIENGQIIMDDTRDAVLDALKTGKNRRASRMKNLNLKKSRLWMTWKPKIMQTPAVSGIFLYTVCTLVIVLYIWASVSTVDEITRGSGEVVPSSHAQSCPVA